jgi:ParB family chromosome partitioning protein
MARKNALGRGLGALIDDASEVNKPKTNAAIQEIAISEIEANPWQPRTQFDEERLKELSVSIKELGIIQPLTLRKTADDKYQIIAGERRFRASKLAGLTQVPAYVRTVEDDAMLELALVENIQREDLDPIEIAISYQRLIDECDLTQESMSDRVGKKRSTIANYLRLLKLPAEIQLGLRVKEISMGHAKALVNIDNTDLQIKLYEKVIKQDLTVRKIEQLARDLNQKKEVEKQAPSNTKSEEYEALQKQLSSFFNTNIQFNRTDKGKGKIVIPFASDEELEKIISILDKAKA